MNTYNYSVLRNSEYRTHILLFGLTIQIPNTKYQIVYKVSKKKIIKINIHVLYKTLNFFLNYSNRYPDGYFNTRILFWVPKKPNTEYRILLGIEIIPTPNTNTTIWSNYSNTELFVKPCTRPSVAKAVLQTPTSFIN